MTDRLADLGQQSEHHYCLRDCVRGCRVPLWVFVCRLRDCHVCARRAEGVVCESLSVQFFGGGVGFDCMNECECVSLLLKVRQEESLPNWIGPG